MRVLYHAEGLHLPSVLWMRRMLDALGPDVATVVTDQDPGPRLSDRYRVVVLRDGPWAWWWRACHRLGLTPDIRKSRQAIARLRAAVEASGVEVVLVHYLTSAVKYDRVWRATSVPVYVHCHGWDVTWDLRLHEPPHQAAHPADYLQRVLALPEHVSFIANSEVTRRRLLEAGLPDRRIRLKYLGVPVSDSPPPARPEREGITILYLGRLVDCKGPDLLIEAFDLARRSGLRGRLVIAGDGPMRGACERLAERCSAPGSIELLGAVDAATGAALRASADVFAAHNRRGPVTRQEEAFGVSFVEAMADGLPVVSGRNGSLPELIDSGVHGLLVEPTDVEAQARAFLELAADRRLRARMGRNGWQRVRERFSLAGETRELRRILGLGG